MIAFEHIIETARDYLPALALLVVVVAALKLLSVMAARRRLQAEIKRTMVPQALMVLTVACGVLLIIVSLPLRDTTRGQVLGLLGVVITGIIALSSTTFFTNALAGIMLRVIRNFKTGDFIQVNDLFGRVTERGLFHIEIQTEERTLTTFPNLYLLTNPVTVMRASGTVISTSLSLGYDVRREDVERCLTHAAEQSGLHEPFVQLIDLADHAVVYKISGFLAETKQLLAARSNLRRCVLDSLHQAGIEIVSPRFINQRVLPNDTTVIPDQSLLYSAADEKDTGLPESVIFDKAETAQQVEQWREKRNALLEKRNAVGKQKDAHNNAYKEKLDAAIAVLERKIASVNALLNKDDEIKKA